MHYYFALSALLLTIVLIYVNAELDWMIELMKSPQETLKKFNYKGPFVEFHEGLELRQKDELLFCIPGPDDTTQRHATFIFFCDFPLDSCKNGIELKVIFYPPMKFQVIGKMFLNFTKVVGEVLTVPNLSNRAITQNGKTYNGACFTLTLTMRGKYLLQYYNFNGGVERIKGPIGLPKQKCELRFIYTNSSIPLGVVFYDDMVPVNIRYNSPKPFDPNLGNVFGKVLRQRFNETAYKLMIPFCQVPGICEGSKIPSSFDFNIQLSRYPKERFEFVWMNPNWNYNTDPFVLFILVLEKDGAAIMRQKYNGNPLPAITFTFQNYHPFYLNIRIGLSYKQGKFFVVVADNPPVYLQMNPILAKARAAGFLMHSSNQWTEIMWQYMEHVDGRQTYEKSGSWPMVHTTQEEKDRMAKLKGQTLAFASDQARKST